jgi:hypothetical protein
MARGNQTLSEHRRVLRNPPFEWMRRTHDGYAHVGEPTGGRSRAHRTRDQAHAAAWAKSSIASMTLESSTTTITDSWSKDDELPMMLATPGTAARGGKCGALCGGCFAPTLPSRQGTGCVTSLDQARLLCTLSLADLKIALLTLSVGGLEYLQNMNENFGWLETPAPTLGSW